MNIRKILKYAVLLGLSSTAFGGQTPKPIVTETTWPISEYVLVGGAIKHDKVSLYAPTGYSYCAIDKAGQTEPYGASDDEAGIRLVNSREKLLEWEWWVYPPADATAKRGIWTEFHVRWILDTASSPDRLANNCEPLPPAQRNYGKLPPPVPNVPGKKPGAAPIITYSPIADFDRFKGWDEGNTEERYDLVAPPSEDKYELCRLTVNEVTRNPRNHEPSAANSKTGYALLSRDRHHAQWQAWVEQDGHLWGPGSWLHVQFGASWIRSSASRQDFIDNKCMSDDELPDTAPPHQFPVEKGGPVTWPQPELRFMYGERLVCRNRDDGTTNYSVDMLVRSPKSCIDANAQLQALKRSRDLCEYEPDGTIDHRLSVWTATRIPTSSCP